MKINLKATIQDYDGKDLISPTDKEPLTFRNVFLNALNAQVGAEVIPAETKNRIYQISKKIYAANEADFTPAQLQLIKERVGKAYSPLVYGRVLDLIDGEGRPEEPLKDLSSAN